MTESIAASSEETNDSFTADAAEHVKPLWVTQREEQQQIRDQQVEAKRIEQEEAAASIEHKNAVFHGGASRIAVEGPRVDKVVEETVEETRKPTAQEVVRNALAEDNYKIRLGKEVPKLDRHPTPSAPETSTKFPSGNPTPDNRTPEQRNYDNGVIADH